MSELKREKVLYILLNCRFLCTDEFQLSIQPPQSFPHNNKTYFGTNQPSFFCLLGWSLSNSVRSNPEFFRETNFTKFFVKLISRKKYQICSIFYSQYTIIFLCPKSSSTKLLTLHRYIPLNSVVGFKIFIARCCRNLKIHTKMIKSPI